MTDSLLIIYWRRLWKASRADLLLPSWRVGLAGCAISLYWLCGLQRSVCLMFGSLMFHSIFSALSTRTGKTGDTLGATTDISIDQVNVHFTFPLLSLVFVSVGSHFSESKILEEKSLQDNMMVFNVKLSEIRSSSICVFWYCVRFALLAVDHIQWCLPMMYPWR